MGNPATPVRHLPAHNPCGRLPARRPARIAPIRGGLAAPPVPSSRCPRGAPDPLDTWDDEEQLLLSFVAFRM